jgi:hypothetical protein
MSKSKSRQPSKATSGTKQGAAANRTTVKANASTTNSLPSTKTVTQPVPPTPTSGKGLTKDAAKFARRQAGLQSRYLAAKRARRNKIIAWTASIVGVLVIASIVTYVIWKTHQPANVYGKYFTPFQEAVFNTTYPPVDNVYCDQLEMTQSHNHVLLTIYIDGKEYPLPANIGIPTDSSGNSTCFYWLHVHPQNQNVIHLESPVNEPFVLGQFIDEGDQQFQSLGFPSQLLLSKGWTIWINGKVYHGSLKDVPLNEHTMITIAYGSTKGVKPVTVYNWSGL